MTTLPARLWILVRKSSGKFGKSDIHFTEKQADKFFQRHKHRIERVEVRRVK